VLALLAFAVLYGLGIWAVWIGKRAPNDNLVYVATSLPGLVGGFVASFFGQELPKNFKEAHRFRSRGLRGDG
jgi:hypothetical protein